MEHARSRYVVTGAMSAAALTLAACGAGGAAHVIGPGATTTSTPATTGPPPTAPTTPTSAPVPVAPTTTTTTPAGTSAVDPGTVAQIDAELNALNAALNQAQSDLTSPNPSDR